MTVLVLMYHKTPDGRAADTWDVPMSDFRRQIEFLLEAQHAFVPFNDIGDAHCRDVRMHVSVTFDDGHGSNIEAVEWLEQVGVRATIFVVPTWSMHELGFIRANEFADLSEKCDLGAHGFSHGPLTQLTDGQLLYELEASRSFLEDALGVGVDSMTAPGGKLDSRVISVARSCGYRRIGNSVPLVNTRLGPSINRIAIRNGDGVAVLNKATTGGSLYWLQRRARLAAAGAVAQLRSRRLG